ncbi:MAG: hypothetical protein ACJA06_000545 [Halocynthiibacter sp.]
MITIFELVITFPANSARFNDRLKIVNADTEIGLFSALAPHDFKIASDESKSPRRL